MSCLQMGHSFWPQSTRILVEHSEQTWWLHSPTAKILQRLRHTGQWSSPHSDTSEMSLCRWEDELKVAPPLLLPLLAFLFQNSVQPLYTT